MSVPAHHPPLTPSIAQENCLARAFASFSEAAGSLERSYVQLQSEIGRLRAELAETNAELEQQREAARRLQALAEVSGVLAHEIRNPLGSLELFATLLANSDLRSEQLSWVHHIQAGLRMLSGTVNNVLSFHGKSPPNLVRTDAGELLHWAVEFLRPMAEEAGVRLELRNGLVGTKILADAHLLQQVILNLALNALQSLAHGGHLRLSGQVVQRGGDVELEISDTGCGIDPEVLDKIYEPGFSTRPGSAGLGLAVCRKIVTQHGGTMNVSSVVGEGTKFVIRLCGGGQ